MTSRNYASIMLFSNLSVSEYTLHSARVHAHTHTHTHTYTHLLYPTCFQALFFLPYLFSSSHFPILSVFKLSFSHPVCFQALAFPPYLFSSSLFSHHTCFQAIFFSPYLFSNSPYIL